MAETLSTAHRTMVLGRLAQIEDELARISAWLDQQGAEKASILTEDAWRSVLASQTLLSRDPVGRSRLVQGRMITTMPPTAG